ncbi:MAG: HD domain-containing protein [Spirochaetales bacterium]|jgi:HD superfamily phosphohydrolase|nr:HD domain-containing protein [Spirochaetales bacterium]
MNNRRILEDLHSGFTEPIRDPLWKNICLSRPFLKIISLGVFQKLNQIRQVGPAYLVYPGATHTRFAHSLGVFHLAFRIISRFLLLSECPALSSGGVMSFLSAALLHDLGHFPYTHSLKELPLKSHETLTAELVQEPPLSELLPLPEMTAAIIDPALPEGSPETGFYRRLLSGMLDPDKLDYLNRDAFYCGVPYGLQDTDYLLSQMIPGKTGPVLGEKGLPAVENLLFSKYLMYKTVYWHKTVRIATAMIKEAVILGMEAGRIKARDLYALTDEEFFHRYSPLPEGRLIREAAGRRFYKTVFEQDFEPGNPGHQELLDLSRRRERARRLARELAQPENLIIDIPEPVSFEIDLPILKAGGLTGFAASGTVFTPPVVEDFSRSLRKIRIFAPPEAEEKLKKKLAGDCRASPAPLF